MANMDQCTCEQGTEEHICPFKEDVHGDSESLCTCCDFCTYQCAMDI